jgi:hypothetical protein
MNVNAETSPPEDNPPAAVSFVDEDCGDWVASLEVGLWLRGLVVWKLLLGLSAEALSSEHCDTFASTCVPNTKHQHVANRGYQHVSNIKKTNSTWTVRHHIPKPYAQSTLLSIIPHAV